MRITLLVIGIALVAGVSSVAGFLFGASQRPWQTLSPGRYPDQFLRAAALLSDDGNWTVRRKQELLADVAARQLTEVPTSSRVFWQEFLRASSLRDGTSGSEPAQLIQELGSTVAFQQQLEAALVNCRSVSDFDRVWDVWLAVDRRIGALRSTLLDSVENKVVRSPELPTDASTDEVEQAIRDHAALVQEIQPSVVALLATSRPGAPIDPPLTAISDRATRLQQAAKAEVDDVERQILALEDELIGASKGRLQTLRATRVTPVLAKQDEEAELGTCALAARAIARLADSVRDADFESWVELTRVYGPASQQRESALPTAPHKDSPTILDGLLDAADRGEEAAFRVQRLRYNFWALDEIRAAETVDNWPGILSRIDSAWLEPPAAALYSSVYNRRIEEIKDGQRRADIVGQILGTPKIKLESF